MSFMAGFADGYIGARDKRIDRETRQAELDRAEANDMFKLSYQSFLARKDERNAQAQKDKKAAATAQAIAQRYNQPLAPVLDALRGGADESIVIDMAKNGDWGVVEGSKPEEGSDYDLEATSADQVDPTVPPEGVTVEGPMFDDPKRQEAFTSSMSKIAEIEGRTPDEVAAELNPVRPTTSSPSGSYSYTPRPEKREFDPALQQQRYADLQAAASTGDPQAVAALQQFESVELPALKSAESMFDKAPEIDLPSSAEGLAVMLAQARASGDAEKIALAEETARIYKGLVLDQAQAEGKFGSAKKSLVRQPDGSVDIGLVVQEPDGSFRNVSNPNSPPIDPQNVYEYTSELAELDKVLIEQSQSKPVQDYKNNLVQVTSGIRIAGDLMGMVDTNPEVLANVSSGLALTVNNVGKELAAFGSLFESAEKGESFALSEDEVRNLERTVAGIDSNAIQSRAAQYALFKAKTLLYIYRMGAAEGQEGRALTEADVARLETMLGASTDVNSYKENLLEYTQSQIDILNDKARGLSQYNVPLDQYKALSGGYNPYGTPAPTPEQFILESGDKQLQETYTKLKNTPITNPSPEYLERQRAKQGRLPGEGIPEEEFDSFYETLPPGTMFIGPDGNKYTKPIEEVQ